MNMNKHFGNSHLFLRLLVIAGGIIVLVLFAHWFELNITHVETWIKSLGALAPLAFILLFVGTTPFFLSVDAFCLAAGVLFPLIIGGFYIIISTYLAAAIIFILGRYFIQDKIKVLLTKHPKLKSIDTLLIDNGLKIMFLLRLLPLPFALLSYAFSITQVKFKPYIISTSGILIYNLTLVYFGYTTKHIASIASSTQSATSINYPLLIAGAIVNLVVLAMIIHVARKTIGRIFPEMEDLNNNKN